MASKRNKSSKPRFNLKWSRNPKEPRLLYLIYRYKKDKAGNHVQLKYSLGEKIYLRNWDPKIQRTKIGVQLPESESIRINQLILKTRLFCLKLVAENPTIELDKFKDELDLLLGFRASTTGEDRTNFTNYIERKYIPNSNKSNRTIAKHISTLNHLKTYQQYIGRSLVFDDINIEFKEQFVKWLYDEYEHSQNHVSKIISDIKLFMKDAHEKEYHNNPKYTYSSFSIPRTKTSKHFLYLSEVQQLLAFDLSKNERLNKTRNLWCIAALSGLRYSDFSRLAKEHFIEQDGIKLIDLDTYKGRTTKPDTQVVIPILPQLEALLEYYDYSPPKAYSSQKMNEYIKEILQKVGIDREVKHIKNVSGKNVTENVPIWDVTTNHSARYTFIDIMLNEYDVPPLQLTKITGQTLKVLMGYERGDKHKNAIKVHTHVIGRIN